MTTYKCDKCGKETSGLTQVSMGDMELCKDCFNVYGTAFEAMYQSFKDTETAFKVEWTIKPEGK